MPTPPDFWARVRFLLVAGTGLFTDGYLNIVISLVVPMISDLYFEGKITTIQSSDIKGALAIGMIAGQLGFGLFGDALGRHKMYGKELIVLMFGNLMVVLLPWKGLSKNGIVVWLTIFRVITGFGTGGDYPMSSALVAERGIFGSRAKSILTVFACIGVGGFVATVVNLILISAAYNAVERDIKNLEWVWRVLLGLGLVPAAASLYARLTIKETKPYEKYVAKDTSLTQSAARGIVDQFRDFRDYFKQWRHAKVLFGVSAVWFLYDIAFYGINYNQTIILSQIGFVKGKTPAETLKKNAIGSIIVQAAGFLPGYFVGIFLPDLIGRKKQQVYFCFATAALYAIWAGVATRKDTPVGGLMTLFTIAQLVLNSGPNCTTFLIPAEVFPTRVRGTAHGVAAASGKAGAVLTSFAFGAIVNKLGLSGVMGLLAGFMALAGLIALLIPETKGCTIDDIEHERFDKHKNKSYEVDDSVYTATPQSKADDPDVTVRPATLGKAALA